MSIFDQRIDDTVVVRFPEQASVVPERSEPSDREIVLANYARWRRFAAAIGPLDIEPDDLVQEAVTRALARGPLSALDQPGAYVRRAIANLASNRRRSLARSRVASRRAQADPVVQPDYPSDLADLESLKPLDRAVLFLVDVEGHSFAEVASILGGTETSHRLRASRARRKLARIITAEHEGGRHVR